MTTAPPLRVGTRRSRLALAQTRTVVAALHSLLDRPVELVEITTHGDVDVTSPLASIGGSGVFVSALRESLRNGEVDLAVHSMKDLPTAPADGLAVAAVPQRQDPRDALVSRGKPLRDLPAGARVGTGSPRRAAALTALRRGYRPVPVRGNIDTRLGLVSGGDVDAVVLAMAGLARLGGTGPTSDVSAFPIEAEQMLPAPGQGALAVESRTDLAGEHGDVARALDRIDHLASRAQVEAERALLAVLEAGCSAPVGALATTDGARLRLTARVWSPDGSREVSGARLGPRTAATDLGRSLAEDLLVRGAADLLPARPPTLFKETAL